MILILDDKEPYLKYSSVSLAYCFPKRALKACHSASLESLSVASAPRTTDRPVTANISTSAAAALESLIPVVDIGNDDVRPTKQIIFRDWTLSAVCWTYTGDWSRTVLYSSTCDIIEVLNGLMTQISKATTPCMGPTSVWSLSWVHRVTRRRRCRCVFCGQCYLSSLDQLSISPKPFQTLRVELTLLALPL